MSPNSYSAPFPELTSLLDALGRSHSRKDLEWTAGYLSRLVGRKKAWSSNYLLGCLKGHKGLIPSRFLKSAVLAALAIVVDGSHPVVAASEIVTVLAPEGRLVNGLLVSGEMMACSVPGCPVAFIPNHPRRKKCYVCSPPKFSRKDL